MTNFNKKAKLILLYSFVFFSVCLSYAQDLSDDWEDIVGFDDTVDDVPPDAIIPMKITYFLIVTAMVLFWYQHKKRRYKLQNKAS
uniref:hypothetical protein n=1 Tax=Flavobacterium sp. TaxID=239 RepID=UPI004049A9DF